ncbi:MAG: glutamine-hydrolyzing GMP synthase, partial [Oscillospiraceae bacterium]|nr:glutamine-hydrolyzing GMP synthase [Oscillospiraceae bacterium]
MDDSIFHKKCCVGYAQRSIENLYGKTVIFVSHEIVLIVDFGGQYNQLIARRVRDMGIYCEIIPWRKATVEAIKEKNPIGIIFTGGPNSVYLETSPHIDPAVFELGVPVLGICYGHQLMAYTLGGKVGSGDTKEYGKTETFFDPSCVLFKDLPEQSITWMSHTDLVTDLPAGFCVTA